MKLSLSPNSIEKKRPNNVVPKRREVYGGGRIFDISHQYTANMPSWASTKGLSQFLWLTKSMKNGSEANFSKMKMPTHTGTHVDAPGHVFDHYFDAGFDVDTLDLEVLNDFWKVQGQTCKPSGAIKGIKPPPGQCNTENDSDCCKQGKLYKTYKCSPPVSSNTKAYLTINSFQKGGDGGGPSECDNQYHSDDTPVVALSTGWYKGGSRCLNNIVIHGNGRSVVAKVVDECDSTMGCDSDHDYQPPCPDNIVDASKAVWEALGVSRSDWGGLDITWTDA